MPRRLTLADYDARSAEARAAFVRAALERHDWALRPAARELDVTASTLQAVIERHGLGEEYARHAHGRAGRPRSAPESQTDKPADE